ncbi:MAG: Uma2 family endonuclease [Symploca sp. SIO2G7]|nr:Uma2 family endonuclease [Symploca sp. SIO2G7]
MVAQLQTLSITWQKLPDSFQLPDDPVDNINQPAIAAALTDSLHQANRLPDSAITITNYGVCATVNNQMVVKAPDWAYVAKTWAPIAELQRSFTPHLEGEVPAIVMEFLSETEGEEYSQKSTYPPGKWFFYESILQVPYYAIFEPVSGDLAVYRLDATGCYQTQIMEENGWYWIESMNLFLGVWQGKRETRRGYWLRWWDAEENLLLWGTEQSAREGQRAEQERLRAEQERLRAEQERLRAEQERLRAEQECLRAEQAEQSLVTEHQQLKQERLRSQLAQQAWEQEHNKRLKLLDQLQQLGFDLEQLQSEDME